MVKRPKDTICVTLILCQYCAGSDTSVFFDELDRKIQENDNPYKIL